MSEAKALAQLGSRFLNTDGVTEARKYCEKAILLDPANIDASDCLKNVVQIETEKQHLDKEQTMEAQIDDAKALISNHKYDQAITLLSQTLLLAYQVNADEKKVKSIEDLMDDAHESLRFSLRQRLISSWLSDLALIVGSFAVLYLLLVLARMAYRLQRETKYALGERIVTRRNWSLLPIDDPNKLGVTEGLIDALKRLPAELTKPDEIPTILPLRPIDSRPYEAEVWRDYLVDPPATVKDFEEKIAFELKLHDFALADAAREMQLKLGGVEIGSLSKLTRSLWSWFNDGVPTINGTVNVTAIDEEQEVTLRLTLTEGAGFATIVASTKLKSATTAMQLTVERAAYKLLHMVAKPDANPGEIDAFAARRQGLKLLQGHVTSGSASAARNPALTQARDNFAFARASSTKREEISELHLFEGIASALLGEWDNSEQHFQAVPRIAFSKSPAEHLLYLQARYNRAARRQRNSSAADDLLKALQLYDQVIASAKEILGQPPNQALTPSQTTGLRGLVTLAQFGEMTTATRYLTVPQGAPVSSSEADRWIACATEFMSEIFGPPGNQNTQPDNGSVFETIELQSGTAYPVLIKTYFDTFKKSPFLDFNKSVPSGSRPILESIVDILDRLKAPSLPPLETCRQIVEICLALANPSKAGPHAVKAIDSGGTDEIFYYAAAAAAEIENDNLNAISYSARYTGSVTIPEFVALRARLQMLLQRPGGLSSSPGLPGSLN